MPVNDRLGRRGAMMVAAIVTFSSSLAPTCDTYILWDSAASRCEILVM